MAKKRQYKKISLRFRSDEYIENMLKNVKVTISKPKKKK